MRAIDRAELQMLREAAKERSRHIAWRMAEIEAGRRRLWKRMDELRAEMAGRRVYGAPAGVEDGAHTARA